MSQRWTQTRLQYSLNAWVQTQSWFESHIQVCDLRKKHKSGYKNQTQSLKFSISTQILPWQKCLKEYICCIHIYTYQGYVPDWNWTIVINRVHEEGPEPDFSCEFFQGNWVIGGPLSSLAPSVIPAKLGMQEVGLI